jgi:hypothetical protein
MQSMSYSTIDADILVGRKSVEEVEMGLVREIVGAIPNTVRDFYLRPIDSSADPEKALRMQHRELHRRWDLWGNGWTGLLLTDFVTASFIREASGESWDKLMRMFDSNKDLISDWIRMLIPQHEKALRKLLSLKRVTLESSGSLIEPPVVEPPASTTETTEPTTETPEPLGANPDPQSGAIVQSKAERPTEALPFFNWERYSCSLDSITMLLMRLFLTRPDIWNGLIEPIEVGFANGMDQLGPHWIDWTTVGMTQLRDNLRDLLQRMDRSFIINENSSARNVLEKLLPKESWSLKIRQKLTCSKHEPFDGEVKTIDAYYRQGSRSGNVSTQAMMTEMVRRSWSLFLTRARLVTILKA